MRPSRGWDEEEYGQGGGGGGDEDGGEEEDEEDDGGDDGGDDAQRPAQPGRADGPQPLDEDRRARQNTLARRRAPPDAAAALYHLPVPLRAPALKAAQRHDHALLVR